MTRSEVQVPRRPPNKNPILAMGFLFGERSGPETPTSEGGGEQCKSALRKAGSRMTNVTD